MGKGGQNECAHHAETICTTLYAETMYIRTRLHLLGCGEMAGEAGVGIIVRYKYDEKLFRRYTRNACERIRGQNRPNLMHLYKQQSFLLFFFLA